MDRLQAVGVALVVAAAMGCDELKGGGGGAPAVTSRVDHVQADPAAAKRDKEAFCDVAAGGDRAAEFKPPAMTGAPLPDSGWRWVNIWATWCKPCVEEMPRLVKWRSRLSSGGKGFALAFVSVDESQDKVAEFQRRFPELPASARLADPNALKGWIQALGLDEGAPIPIHVLVDPRGRVRCVRAGAVGERDFATVEQLVGEG